jgi:aspartate aminotransferase
MMKPKLSDYAQGLGESPLRAAWEAYNKRPDKPNVLNLSIGNVFRPTHPKMQERMAHLMDATYGSPFAEGVVPYGSTAGHEETQQAVRNIIKARGGVDADDLGIVITPGSSYAMGIEMELTCGQVEGRNNALLTFDPTYANYHAIADQLSIDVISIPRVLGMNGKFSMCSFEQYAKIIEQNDIGMVKFILGDNPTGQYWPMDVFKQFAAHAVKNGIWVSTDAAYEGFQYDGRPTPGLWQVTDEEIPGLRDASMSLESVSKLFNFCGGRVGALVSANKSLVEKATTAAAPQLGAGTIDQWIVGALAHETPESIINWIISQNILYEKLMINLRDGLRTEDERYLVSAPEAAIYCIVSIEERLPGVKADDFVMWSAKEGSVAVDGELWTFLGTPAKGFYNQNLGRLAEERGSSELARLAEEFQNGGEHEIRIAFTLDDIIRMGKFPRIFDGLVRQYEREFR